MERLPGLFGRLANHPPPPPRNEANMKMVEVELSCIGERLVILKARMDIAPFELLRLHYGDKVAQALFDDSS